jgi:nitrilase
LLRARAIESQAYVIASAQGGEHENGRKTHGHSMIIDPWGRILAELPKGEGVIFAEIDPSLLNSVRTRLPSLAHRVL